MPTTQPKDQVSDRILTYQRRTEQMLESVLPDENLPPRRLHQAMRYSILGGGKRLRPLLVYAAGELFGAQLEALDAPAAAIELMHAFSLIHDDLPAMDDDDLRRGRPSTHRAFDEATAILAADAMQPLAFQVLSNHPPLLARPDRQVRLIRLLAEACGSIGMTGGQAIDLASEGQRLDQAELEHMYRLKTGQLLRTSILSGAWLGQDLQAQTEHRLERFADALGLAFQIRDDLLDEEGTTEKIGKQAGADAEHDKATWPRLFGREPAHQRVDALLAKALEELEPLGDSAETLRWLTRYAVRRDY